MQRPEWPTIALFLLVYGGWLGLTFAWTAVPTPVLFMAGGLLMALHGSLQHEAIHGHPTRSRRINTLLAGWPLWLWLPYARYRDSHLAHHASELTHPEKDPESFYLTATAARALSPTGHRLRAVNQTLVGRLLIGPFISLFAFYRGEPFRQHVGTWLIHLLWTTPILAWLWWVEIPATTYLLCFVYPGLSLTLLRSFAEHRPAEDRAHRSLILEAEWPFALLFLNNNLHAVHHRSPGLAWYRLPARYRAMRSELLRENGDFLMIGYRTLFRRFAFRMKDQPLHPEETS